MSGILDKKTRILDTIVTPEGRRQIASGDLRIQFVSFTDDQTFYAKDVVSGSDDASTRIYFEAAGMPQDQITFESDDSGFMKEFKGSSMEMRGGKILSGAKAAKPGKNPSYLKSVTDEKGFFKLADSLLASTLNNFDQQNIIGTIDPFLDHNDFELSHNEVVFKLTDDYPIPHDQLQRIAIDDVESLFQDKRLSHVDQFSYLPPTDQDGALLGDYPSVSQNDILNLSQLEKEIVTRPGVTVNFIKSSRDNNVICQFFEIQKANMVKLDVIDFGEFITGDLTRPNKHFFFVGKVYPDGKGLYTFVNLFVLVFD